MVLRRVRRAAGEVDTCAGMGGVLCCETGRRRRHPRLRPQCELPSPSRLYAPAPLALTAVAPLAAHLAVAWGEGRAPQGGGLAACDSMRDLHNTLSMIQREWCLRAHALGQDVGAGVAANRRGPGHLAACCKNPAQPERKLLNQHALLAWRLTFHFICAWRACDIHATQSRGFVCSHTLCIAVWGPFAFKA